MPLQQIVEYFNDRLEQQHQYQTRPFVLENGVVHGLFGPIRMTSQLAPISERLNAAKIIGHCAQLKVSSNIHAKLTEETEEISLEQQLSGYDTVINFDRLSRTVHMLNYLPQSHLDELLFVEVDPRHILGVKQDHGAYFEEVIVKCGLQTANVTIGLTVDSVYSRLYPVLLKGLENYQRRGYRLLLKFDLTASEDKSLVELINRVSPDFIGFSAQHLDSVRDSKQLEKLQELNNQAASLGSRSILFDIEDQRQLELAKLADFYLVQSTIEPSSQMANEFLLELVNSDSLLQGCHR